MPNEMWNKNSSSLPMGFGAEIAQRGNRRIDYGSALSEPREWERDSWGVTWNFASVTTAMNRYIEKTAVAPSTPLSVHYGCPLWQKWSHFWRFTSNTKASSLIQLKCQMGRAQGNSPFSTLLYWQWNCFTFENLLPYAYWHLWSGPRQKTRVSLFGLLTVSPIQLCLKAIGSPLGL